MAIWSTYEMVGIAEDVSPIISNITPTETPMLTSLSTEKVTQTTYQWQEDALRAAAKNAKAEGFTASSITPTATTMRSNVTQILSTTVEVSGTSNAVKSHGRGQELAYQLAKAGKSIKQDLEYSIVGSKQTKVTGDDTVDGAGTAREFAGYQAQIDSGADNTIDAGTAATLSEQNLLDANQGLYDVGGNATIFSVKPSDALVVANFAYRQSTGTSTTHIDVPQRTRDVGQATKIVNVVDVYRSPFGEQRVVLNRHQATDQALLYDPSNWKLVVLRPWFRETLAKTGDKISVMLCGEYGLKHSNKKASALITDLA